MADATSSDAQAMPELSTEPSRPRRERLPDDRESITHKFHVGELKGYLTVGLYPDGRPGEVFIKIDKHGSTIAGLVNTIAVLTSVALQYGVPMEQLARKFEYTRFEPSGPTGLPGLRRAHSLVDYVFRWLGQVFSEDYRQEHLNHLERSEE